MKFFSLTLLSAAVAWTRVQAATPDVIVTNGAAAAIVSSSANVIVARGKGFEITRQAMDQVLANAKVGNPQDQLPPDAGIHVLTHLIEIQLVLQKATDTEKAEGKQRTDMNFTNIVKTMGEPEFEHQLKAALMTADDLRLMLFQEDTAQTSLTRQLGIKVMDADAKKYFDDNPGAMDEPEKARIRELLLLTTKGYTSDPLPEAIIQAKHKQIFELYKRVRAGEDFAALAKQYNEDFISNSADEITFRRDQMEYGDLAFSMNTSQISGVITNEEGYRIFELLEKIPTKKVGFADVADKLKKMLAGAQKRKLAPAYIKQLWKEADVEILDPGLKTATAANAAQTEEAAKAQAVLTAKPVARGTNMPPRTP